jgi:hypothetical protein
MTNIILSIIILLIMAGFGWEWLIVFHPKCKMCDQRFHWKMKFPAGRWKYCPAYKKIMRKMGVKTLVDFHRVRSRIDNP